MQSCIDSWFYPKPSEKPSAKDQFNQLKHQFKLPIEYNTSLYELDDSVKEDIESKAIYPTILGSDIFMDYWTTFYTKDTTFLQEHQSYIKHIAFTHVKDEKIDELYMRWKEHMLSNHIRDNYYFIDWDHLEFLNYNSKAMLYLGFTSILSPVLSLLTPFVFLLMPFVIMKCIMGVSISFENYKNILMQYAHRNTFGKCIKMLTENGNISTKITAVSMLGIYITSLYQNVLSCIRYYSNLYKIKRYIQDTHYFFSKCETYINILETEHYSSDAMKLFIGDCGTKKQTIRLVLSRLEEINNNPFSPKDTFQIGNMMSLFYALRFDASYQKIYQYGFELYWYMEQMYHLKELVLSEKLQPCKYSGKRTSLKKSYHVSLLKEDEKNIVKNNIRIKNNYIVTGPNASGKTTLIKNVLLNLILSQQIGVGCYHSSTKVQPFTYFYSYLNIPDTSHRDSLFQAEARRCLDIIHKIEDHNERAFLIFDELYSGTNPYEATIAGIAFLSHISKLNIRFMITTHYHDICKAKELKKIKNIHMSFSKNKYEYRVVKGPSTKKGGFKVLEDMEYPTDILDQIKSLVKETSCVPSENYKCEA